MVKSKKKKKNIAWIKFPVNLKDDERIAELFAKKGVAGFGVYLCIIAEIYRRACRCLTMTQVEALKFAGATKKTILEVVNDYGLFRNDKMGHIYSAIDFLGFDDADECESADDAISSGFESSLSPTPARVYNKDKDEDKYHHIDGDDAESSVDYIGMIPENSQWTESALMKCGFGSLIKRNWQETIGIFRNHAIANCTIGQIRSVDDAKKYFHFYITNSTSGNMLRKALDDFERQHPQQNPYRFEDVDSANGHRCYHGIPIPDDAPPRPDERADWDYENECWISPTNFNQKN